ncbi:MAG: xanthine dehydrogenase family protein molybdopterin-binding subunit [Burkholderiales bacterium]|nr:xanthine dehydrogenase family protein molybdopterin-binding subunit [Burkholderiales bacterium]
MGWTRRLFLTTAGLAGAGLVVGGGVLAVRQRRLLAFRPPLAASQHAFSPWLKIGADGSVVLMGARAEMGQGVLAMMAMVVAEELGADYPAMRFEDPPVANVYRNVVATVLGLPIQVPEEGILRDTVEVAALQAGLQITGGSTSTRDAWHQLRAVGAGAREVLKAAAAKRWGVAAGACDTEGSMVVHAPSGRRMGFGEVAADAAALEWPERFAYRDPKTWRYLGKSPARLDVPGKVDGSARFGIDVRLPGLRYAAIRHAPQFGARVQSVAEKAGFRAKGVEGQVNLGNAVAVVADSWWTAKQALEQLDIRFAGGSEVSDAQIFAAYAKALDEPGRAHAFEKAARLAEAKSAATKKHAAEFRVPYLAHACMEPMNATARLTEGRLEVWCGNQAPNLVRDLCAKACGLAADRVAVHTTLLGGGFGRRADLDYAVQASRIAAAFPSRPVQLIWSREEDISQDVYRPSALARYEAGLHADGSVAFWHARSAHSSPGRGFAQRNIPYMANDLPDHTAVEAAAGLPYALGERQVEYARVDAPVPVGFWRSVNNSQNGFFAECFVDELAGVAGKDPFEFRRALLKDAPRHRAVLEKAAQMSGWGRDAPGRHKGIALVASFGSIVAEVVEISGPPAADLRIERAWVAADCGLALDPRNVAAQLRSGAIYGLSAALWGGIGIDKGRVQQSNFHDYRVLALADAPPIEVALVSQGSPMGGVGEIGVPPSMPALANAVSRATGKRVRALPILAG